MAEVIPFPSRAKPRPVLDLARDMGARVENMIRIQMEAYPKCWSDEERREMAIEHLRLGDDGPEAA